MASKKVLPLAYVKFLNLVAAVRQLPGLPEIDAVEDQILSYLARSWYAGQRVTVLEAMNGLPDISPSTVQRRLKSLRVKGMLRMQNDEFDSRFKYVESTDLAVQYFAALGQCIQKAQSR